MPVWVLGRGEEACKTYISMYKVVVSYQGHIHIHHLCKYTFYYKV